MVALPRLRRRTKPIFTRGPKALQPALLHEPEKVSGPGEPPGWFPGTRPEWWCYWALERLGLKPDVDFRYQSARFGGRLSKGGAVVDFEIINPPIGININGVFWHYERGSAKQASDAEQRIRLASFGLPVVTIDEDDIGRDPVYYVRDALQGIDHSRVVRGFS